VKLSPSYGGRLLIPCFSLVGCDQKGFMLRTYQFLGWACNQKTVFSFKNKYINKYHISSYLKNKYINKYHIFSEQGIAKLKVGIVVLSQNIVTGLQWT